MPVVSMLASNVVFVYSALKRVPSSITFCVFTVLFIVEICPRFMISCNSFLLRATITFSGFRSVWIMRHLRWR